MRFPRWPRFPRFRRVKRTRRQRRRDYVVKRPDGFRQRVEKEPVSKPRRPTIANRLAAHRALAGLNKGKYTHWEKLWASMEFNDASAHRAAEAAAMRIRGSIDRYQAVEAETGVPWEVIAVIHHLEAGGRFSRHLHNGDSLLRKTAHVPAGRPKHAPSGPSGAYTWEESAIDALMYDKLDEVTDKSVGSWLHQLERYNGLGYLKYHKDVNTPYLWSGSTHYDTGKYVRDGRWDQNARSKQTGAALILRKLNFA